VGGCVCGVFCILMKKGIMVKAFFLLWNSTKGVCTVSVPLFQRVMHVMSSQKRAGGFDRAPGMEWRGKWNFVGAWALDRTMLIWTGSNCQWSCALHIPSWSRPPCCCRWWWKCDDLFYLTQISISSIWVSVIKPAWTIHTHSSSHQHINTLFGCSSPCDDDEEQPSYQLPMELCVAYPWLVPTTLSMPVIMEMWWSNLSDPDFHMLHMGLCHKTAKFNPYTSQSLTNINTLSCCCCCCCCSYQSPWRHKLPTAIWIAKCNQAFKVSFGEQPRQSHLSKEPRFQFTKSLQSKCFLLSFVTYS
jgi:hypothetical protein